MVEKLLLKDKKVVAAFLDISPRTLDRYIKKYSFNVFSHRGEKKVDLVEVLRGLHSNDLRQVQTELDSFRQFEEVFVNKKPDKGLFKDKKTDGDSLRQTDKGVMSDGYISSKNKDKDSLRQEKTKNDVEKETESNLSSVPILQKETEIYKKLYEETLNDLKNKQERLEGATYRVGQLEAQIKNTVPLLTYRQKEDEVLQLTESYQKETETHLRALKQTERELGESKLLKNVYTAMLFAIVITVPLALIYYLNFKI